LNQVATKLSVENLAKKSSSNSEAPWTETASRWGLCFLLAFAVLAFGAVESWATAVLELGSCFVFALTIILLALRGDTRQENDSMLFPMAAWAAVIGIQVLFHLTSYWYASYCAFLKFTAYAALFVAASRLFRTDKARTQFAFFVSVFGGAVAVFAILQDFTAHGALYWLRIPESPSHIFGPYVNRNHYAGLMEMLAPFAFALAWHRRSFRRDLLLFMGALMTASIFLSGSRGGMLAFVSEVAFLFVVTRRQSSGRRRPLIFALGLCVPILVLWMGSSEMFSGLAPEGVIQATVDRAAIYRDTLRMLPGHWLLGWGAGTFSDVFPQFRSFHSELLVNETHNDYLQVLVELGIIGFVAMLTFVVMLYRRALHNLGRGSIDHNRSIQLAALTGCTGLLIHGLWDFNLQIPANAAWFFVLAALASCDCSARRGVSAE
jgi:O-antigen ligase